MSMSAKKRILWLLPAVLCLAFLANCSSPKEEQTAPGNKSFGFTLPDLQGQVKTLKNYSDKKLIIVDFWATWCPPCRNLVPHLNTLYHKYGSQISLVGISIDKDGPASVDAFVKDMNISYPVLINGLAVAKEYGISSIPTLLMVDSDGIILKKWAGFADEQALDQMIQELLTRNNV